MGTYYRWRKSTIEHAMTKRKLREGGGYTHQPTFNEGNIRFSYSDNAIISNGKAILKEPIVTETSNTHFRPKVPQNKYVMFTDADTGWNELNGDEYDLYYTGPIDTYIQVSRKVDPSDNSVYFMAYLWTFRQNESFYGVNTTQTRGDFIGYAYSISATAYPTDGVSGDYYYDQRTTVTSPTNPSSITFGTPKAGESLTITAGASTDVVGSGTLTYVFERQIDNGSWTQVAATYNKTITDGVPGSGEYINYRVKARDKNGVESSYYTGTKKPIEYPILITDPGIPQYKYPISGKEMLVTWDPSAVPEKAPLTYIVEKQIDSEPWSEVARVSENSYTFTVPEVTTEGKRLTIRVKATDTGGNESKYSTGKTTEILYHKVVRFIPWNFGTDFRIRQFTKNSRSQYQTMLAGSTAEIVATGNLRLGDMPVGTLVRVSNNTIEDINWKIADQNHPGYPENSTTLITDKIIRCMPCDANEPNNPNTFRATGGNNRYIYSNIAQWLNSNEPEGAWYSAKHEYDAPPTNDNVYEGANDYDTWAGFLFMLNHKFVKKLIETTLTVRKDAVDGGGSESFNAKMFFASTTEVRSENEGGIVEGSPLRLFTDDTSRVCYPSEECVRHNDPSNKIETSKPAAWHLRTPFMADNGDPSIFRGVMSNGKVNYLGAHAGWWGSRPLCNISADTMLNPNPNPDGSYNIVWE